jgi:hypothetical protein
MIIKNVDFGIALDYLAGCYVIAGRKGIQRRPQHGGRVLGHLCQIRTRLQLGLVVQIKGRPRDVASVIGYAFKDRGHLGNRYYKSQISSSRLPQSNEVNALAIDFDLDSVYIVIMIQHLAGLFTISLYERVHSSLKSCFGLAAQQ